MKEYKREKGTLESQLVEAEKRSKYHDDHLRTIDVWFDQVNRHHARTLEHDADMLLAYRRDQNIKWRTTAPFKGW
jgi:hypothetical protein